MENSNVKTNFSVRQITMVGMLSAISIFLGITRLGFIPIPFINATIMHIPVIIGSIVAGPIVGSLIGLVFGLFSMYNAFTTPTPTAFIFLNPVIAILPRVLIGIVSYYSYIFLKDKIKNKSLSIGIPAILGSFTNTIGVMGLIYLIYLNKYATVLGFSKKATITSILTIISVNGSTEAAVAAVISIAVVSALLKIRK